MPVVLISKASPLDDDAVIAAAAKMEGEIGQAFLDAIASIKDKVVLNKLATALEAGDINYAMAILALDKNLVAAFQGAGLEAGITSFREALQQTFQGGATAAISKLPKTVSTEMSFNLLNARSVNFLESYSFERIQQIVTDTKEAIREITVRGYTTGIAPIAQAREIRETIGLTASMEKAVQNFRSALVSGRASDLREALTRALRDKRYDRQLLRAIESGSGLAKNQIDFLTERYRQKYLKYRAEMIARTESIRASNEGQMELWRQAEEQGLLPDGTRRKWLAAGGGRTCDICSGINGKVVGMTEEFLLGVSSPPAHPHCRCAIALVFPKRKEMVS